jgi:carboxyl-terminal processing protease
VRKSLFVGLAAIALLAMSATLSPALAVPATAPDAETMRLLEVFGSVLADIDRSYVRQVDHRHEIEGALDGVLSSLDPHSGYIPPKAFATMMSPSASHAPGGIGLHLVSDGGTVTVATPIPGGPADRAGLQPGDSILAVDGHNAAYEPLATVIDRLSGAIGQTVTLRISRSASLPFDVAIVREVVKYPSTDFRTVGDYGVLRITALERDTVDQTVTALKDAAGRPTPLRGLILDLRNCPGGLMSTAISVSSLFLDGGDIASERGRKPGDVQRYSALKTDEAIRVPVVVLVNERTAAGCEIIAAALQDRSRAKVVGMPTYGQGTVQTVIPLTGGVDGAIKFTTAYIYRPSGRPIEKLGVIPDFLVAATKVAAENFANHNYAFSEASLPNALDAGQPAQRELPRSADAPPASTTGDYQLSRALEVLGTSSGH